MSRRLSPVSKREFKMGLDSAYLFKKIVIGDLGMVNHISGEVPSNSLYYFAGKDVINILESRNAVHGKHLQEKLLHSPNHTRLRQFILAGELSRHHGNYQESRRDFPKFPDWMKPDARTMVIDYAIGTYGAIKHGHADISDLFKDDFYQHVRAIINDLIELWKPDRLSPKFEDDGRMGRNALYDLLLARSEKFIGSYGAIE
jgi:hypothetical protein